MWKCKKEHVAREIADENAALYGMSVFDGAWYVGTVEELKGAGVAEIIIGSLPTLGWPHERVKAAWRNFSKKRVRVNTLKRGDIFFSSEGDAWRYVRPDGALSGYHHVETLNGEERTGFAGNAEVLRAR